jgi:hypothetical protein
MPQKCKKTRIFTLVAKRRHFDYKNSTKYEFLVVEYVQCDENMKMTKKKTKTALKMKVFVL